MMRPHIKCVSGNALAAGSPAFKANAPAASALPLTVECVAKTPAASALPLRGIWRTRRFYVFKPPRELAEIDAELKGVTDNIVRMIGELSH